MGNKKHIIAAAVLAMLSTGLSPAIAQDVSLTQMDVKKSSVTDTVDVTFYTTGQSAGSVVTRKSNNRYVVLLPNISSTSSVAPSLGAVKDLISDVEVKHVNDGIGGYTKITFSTTKPINIKTYTKRANPVTAVQKDYRDIIAQNNAKSAEASKSQTASQAKPQQVSQPKPAQSSPAAQSQPKTNQAESKVEKPVANKVVKAESKTEKPAVQKDSKTVQKPKLIPLDMSKISKAVTAPKIEQVQKSVEQKAVESKPAASSDYVPKMKYDENGKRIIDLEPRVSHKIESESAQAETSQVQQNTAAEQSEENNTLTQDEKNNQKSHSIPLWMIIAGGVVSALGMLSFVLKALARDSHRKSLESFFSVSSPAKFTKPREKYSDIVNNSDLNWQEKYRRYTAQQEVEETVAQTDDMSYVTNLGATKKAIIAPEVRKINSEIDESERPVSALFDKKLPKKQLKNISENKVLKGNTEEFKNKMRAKISQLEHSLAQTSAMQAPENNPGEVKSEDKSIISKISDVKLKSFSKPMSLRESNRGSLNIEKKEKPYQEGRFVKLKDSPLSMSRRQSASTELNASNLIDKGDKYLKNNYGEMKMNREHENYLLSSLDEYLSILDSEGKSESRVSVAESLANIRPASEPMSRSGVTNPISRGSNPISGRVSSPSVNGLVVKSGYNIDSERGFYIVNMDGVSALVGRIKDRTYVLKKFDRVIDSTLQVRQDDTNVYIVKAGRYKCLVDVSKDKMGTLIEI
ncbi:MAG: hypothetical protein NC191_05675 [Muribaculaceae bacterium]|nr:hypothetical protein [Muribaculaceae bacterium]